MQMQDGFPVWPDGEWQTVRRIGQGSYGAVYEILRKHEVAERAAMKVISIPRTDSEIDMLFGEGSSVEDVKTEFTEHKQALLTEYSLMRKLNGHSNVVNCDDVKSIQHEDGIGWDIFIRMELVTPLPLALGPEVPPPQAVQIGMDLCRALMLCAKHGIVHRDIKPSNIFYSDNGAYKLGDFGISKVIEQTTGGTKIGTYDYMAPEVFRNQPYGAQSDICSLGLVLYWLLNEKRLPFLPLDKTRLSMAEREEAWGRRMQGEPLPPPAHGSDELKRVVLKACAYDPADRYRRAEDLLRDLEAVLSPVRDSAAPADPVTLNEPTVGIPGLHSGTSHGETAFPEDPENTIGIDRRKTAQGRAASADAAPEPAGFQERHGKEAAEEEAKREAQAARREPEGSDAGRNGGKKKGAPICDPGRCCRGRPGADHLEARFAGNRPSAPGIPR